MRHRTALSTLIALLILAASLPLPAADEPKTALPQKLENITLDDLDGRRWVLHDLKDVKAVVLYFTGTECPLANRYIERVNQLSATFVRKGVVVLAVNSNGLETVQQIRRHQKATGLAVNVLLDRDQRLADQLKVEVTPTVIVVDATWRVRYRGLFDDSKIGGHVKNRYAHEAVAALVDGRENAVSETEPWGCMIQRALQVTKTDITYAEHIAPLLHKHCVSCHRPGGDAPFPLTFYEEARRWANTMRVFTRLHVMPPWKPVNEGTFHGERFLSAAEVATLARWVDGGTPAGDLSKAPALPKFAAGWTMMGKPNLVLTAPEFEVGAHGDDQFRCFVLPTNLPAERWLRAVEVKPGNSRVVHHVSVYVDSSDAAEKLDAADPQPGYQGTGAWPGFTPVAELDGWAPGKIARPLPDGTGWLLPARSRIVLEIHYHPNGRQEKDQTQVGLWFAEKANPVRTIEVAARQLRIPAGAKGHKVTAEQVVKEDLHALAVRPHMHHLGREIKVEAEFPDRSRKVLLHIRDWDFHWQETYWFKTPVPLPQGTRLHLEAIYDNSSTNPNNPNIVLKPVSWGNQPTDEMCLVSFSCIKDEEKKPRDK